MRSGKGRGFVRMNRAPPGGVERRGVGGGGRRGLIRVRVWIIN